MMSYPIPHIPHGNPMIGTAPDEPVSPHVTPLEIAEERLRVVQDECDYLRDGTWRRRGELVQWILEGDFLERCANAIGAQPSALSTTEKGDAVIRAFFRLAAGFYADSLASREVRDRVIDRCMAAQE